MCLPSLSKLLGKEAEWPSHLFAKNMLSCIWSRRWANFYIVGKRNCHSFGPITITDELWLHLRRKNITKPTEIQQKVLFCCTLPLAGDALVTPQVYANVESWRTLEVQRSNEPSVEICVYYASTPKNVV